MEERILLSMNHMGGTERRYVADAFDTDWIVPLGPHVDEFEHRLEQFLGCDKRVLALCAGTAAIHLGLILLGVGEGDEVICQALTFSASANPIKYQGAVPVFVDSEPSTMNMDPDALDSAIADRIRVTGRKPKAIVVVDLYGMPADMTRILSVADRYGIPVLEDAAEALGSTYKDQPCGTFGSYAALSFNGNKIITTSGGGALVCPDDVSRKRALFYATQAREDKPYYYHEHIGYNYRLSNVCGAIGCGQMDVLPERVKRRRYIHDIYMAELGSMPGVTVQTNPSTDYNSNFWLTTVQLDDADAPDRIRLALAAEKIETRLLWRPMQMQPVFADAAYYGGDVSETLFRHGLCLPSGSILTDEQILRVCRSIKNLL